MNPAPGAAVPDPWPELRRFTAARLALGRAGDSLPTTPVLELGLAHARARDAVRDPFPREAMLEKLRAGGWETQAVRSAVSDRVEYLLRPDLGRRLGEADQARLRTWIRETPGNPKPDVVFVVADGLSARAAPRHAPPLLARLRPLLAGWTIGPVIVAEQARVALGDPIGEILGAAQVVVLIGERPGLSSPDSLGAYLTYAPRTGRTDAERNCVSNIRPEGLGYADAARTLHGLMEGARRLRLSGIGLKDESGEESPPPRPSVAG